MGLDSLSWYHSCSCGLEILFVKPDLSFNTYPEKSTLSTVKTDSVVITEGSQNTILYR